MLLHDPDRGWKRLPDGDARLRKELGVPQPKKGQELRHLFIYKNQLMYDIDAQVGIVTTARRTEAGTELNAQNDMLDKFQGQINRWIDKYIEKVKERLILALIDSYAVGTGDEMKDWTEYEFLLQFPEWWDDTAWKPLVDSVHDYIVSGVLSEYFRLTLTSKDPVTIDKMEQTAEGWDKMKTHLCQHKQGTIRKTLNPMGF